MARLYQNNTTLQQTGKEQHNNLSVRKVKGEYTKEDTTCLNFNVPLTLVY